jgi:Tfp pilus assembly protein PilF
MRKCLKGLLFAVLGSAFVPAIVLPQQSAPAVTSPQELFNRLSRSVFVVEVLDAQGSLVAAGSAVSVTPNQVVTNKHVISEGAVIRLRQESKTWPATVTYIDPDHDLCRLTATDLGAPAVVIRPSSTLAVGERVYSIGAAEGLELTMSEGIISGLRASEQSRLVQTSAAISPGSSGGGLFDTEGRLVGITTFFLKEGQNLNFALPADWVESLFTHRVSPEENKSSVFFEALSYFQIGNQMLQAEDYRGAVTAFHEVVHLKPGESDAWYCLGFAYASLHQNEEARRAYQESVRLKPQFADAWGNLGAVDVHLRLYDEAKHAIQEAVGLRPDDVAGWTNLGVAEMHLEEYGGAEHAFQKAISLKSNSAGAWYGLGIVYCEQNNRSEALQVYEKLRTLDESLAEKLGQKLKTLPVTGQP